MTHIKYKMDSKYCKVDNIMYCIMILFYF